MIDDRERERQRRLHREKIAAVDRVIDLVNDYTAVGPGRDPTRLYDNLRAALELGHVPGHLEEAGPLAEILATDVTGGALLLAIPGAKEGVARVGTLIRGSTGRVLETSIVVRRENSPGLTAKAFRRPL